MMSRTARRSDPYKGFNFRVEVDGDYVAGFNEVSGLEKAKPATGRKIPGLRKFSNVTLKRGIMSDRALALSTGKFSGDLTIELLDESRAVVRVYRLRGCRIAKVQSPRLEAKGKDVAIESLELQCERCDVEED